MLHECKSRASGFFMSMYRRATVAMFTFGKTEFTELFPIWSNFS
jgi:hypothetical protein